MTEMYMDPTSLGLTDMKRTPNSFGPRLDLPKGEVHLWFLPYDPEDESLLGLSSEILPASMIERSEHFKFHEHRHEYVIGQAALRVLLSRYTGSDVSSIQIGRHTKGKPYSGDDPSLRFNMSNSDGIVAFAFTRDHEVGVDVERIRPLPEMDELLEGNFHPEEIRQIKNGPTATSEDFFRFWTYKESYLKAIGEGMRLTPDHLEFRRENGEVRLLSVPEVFSDEKWYFREFSPQDGYVGTLAYKGNGIQIIENRLEPSSISREG